MTSVDNAGKICSQDKKIWVGMKVAEANKTEEDMKIFNFADDDGDGKISQAELDRYDGPLLVENFPEKKGRIIGNAGIRPLNALYIADNEVDYYPGLKIETVDKAGRVVYNQIDTNRDNNLSKKEMEDVTKSLECINKTRTKLKKIEDKRELLSVSGILGGIWGALIVAAKTGDNPMPLFGDKGLTTKQGWIFAGLSLAAGVGLSLLNRYVAKSKAQKEIEQLQNDTQNHPYIKNHLEELKQIV